MTTLRPPLPRDSAGADVGIPPGGKRGAAGEWAGAVPPGEPLAGQLLRVWLSVPSGRARAIKQKYLAAQLDMSTRTLQQYLKDLTEVRGLPIASACSPPYGVFVPETPAEVDAFVAQLRSRALSCFKRIAALSRAAGVALLREQQLEIGFPEPSLPVAGAICCQCGKEFAPSRSTQIYCTSACRFDAARERGSI